MVSEKKLLKFISVCLAVLMFIWGLINVGIMSYFFGSPMPYGFVGQILGVIQIFFGIIITYLLVKNK